MPLYALKTINKFSFFISTLMTDDSILSQFYHPVFAFYLISISNIVSLCVKTVYIILVGHGEFPLEF